MRMMNTVFVGGLPLDVTERTLRDLFSMAGDVHSVRIAEHAPGEPKGYAFVEMQDEDQVINAINSLDGADVHGKRITVYVARPDTPDRDAAK